MKIDTIFRGQTHRYGLKWNISYGLTIYQYYIVFKFTIYFYRAEQKQETEMMKLGNVQTVMYVTKLFSYNT